MEKKAVNLRKQAVITKCRGYNYAEPSRDFEKAVDFRALKIIDHRLAQIDTD